MRRILFAVAALCVAAGAPARADLVTVPTAAGIEITVASDMADAMVGFIADLVATGAKPYQIHCYSWARSHVPNSLHHSGHACDFNGSANRWPPMNAHRVSALAARWGLFDGCNLTVTVGKGRAKRRVPDCGHIDARKG